jgi:hypothetical protein
VVDEIYVAAGTENNLESHKAELDNAETSNVVVASNSEMKDSVNNGNPPLDLLSTIW